jgi:hypothetical protein
MTTRAEKLAILEAQRDDARRALHHVAAAYTADGAGTKAQADLEEAARTFTTAEQILRRLLDGRRF